MKKILSISLLLVLSMAMVFANGGTEAAAPSDTASAGPVEYEKEITLLFPGGGESLDPTDS